jgi:hypothetical protein
MSELALTQYDFRPDYPEGQNVVPQADLLKGLNKPEEFDPDRFIDVMRAAVSTYEIFKGPHGTNRERIVFNADQASNASIKEGPTSFTGVRRNPGNMLESGVAATIGTGAAYDYMTPLGNTPSGPYRPKDLMYIINHGRYTKGLGTDNNPYVAIDSLLDEVELYHQHDLTLPTHVRGNAEGARLALGLKTAFGNIRGTILDGIDGISPSAHYTQTRITQDIISRWNRQIDDSDSPGAISPLHVKEVKSLMSKIYHGRYQYAHMAPIPAVLHPIEFAEAGLMNFVGFRRNNDLANLDRHAVYQDLRASIYANDSPTLMAFGSKSAIHGEDTIMEFSRKIVSNLPKAKQTANRLVRVLVIEDAGHDQNTDDTLIRPAIERYGFSDIKHMMSLLIGNLVEELDLNVSRAKTNIISSEESA